MTDHCPRCLELEQDLELLREAHQDELGAVSEADHQLVAEYRQRHEDHHD